MTNHPHRHLNRPTLSITAPALLFLTLCGGCASVPQIWPSASTVTVTSPTTGPTNIQQYPPRLAIFPESLTIGQGESWSFAAAIAVNVSIDHMPEPVSWSIQEGTTGGSITVDGIYTAPSIEGVYHVIATSKADPAKTATASVKVGRGVVLAGDPNGTRISHTATLLPGGQVIVAGGYNVDYWDVQSQLIVDRADRYDPATALFQFAAKVSRSNHTATLLPNGDLLSLGGYSTILPPNGYPVVPIPAATAEILTAGAGTIQPTADMSIARAEHTATLLPSGLVLITGGVTPSSSTPQWYSQPTSTAELYDPASGTSSPAGSMSVARTGHLAILLQNGKVLVVGSGSADLYDPATNTFTPTGSPNFKGTGYGSTATLLPDGRVLVAGGAIYDPNQYPFVSQNTVEFYDPAAGQFVTYAGKLSIARSFHTATLLPNGTVLIAGGFTSRPTPGDDEPATPATETFDPGTNTFTPGHAMKAGREGHTATLLLDGTVLFVGGSWANPVTSTEIFH